MMGIDGNVWATIQTYTTEKNAIGERVQIWKDAQRIWGWLDLASGSSGYSSYNAKIQESTHLFICGYVPLLPGIEAEKVRMIVNGKAYDVLLIDNPMGLNEQLEFYLKFTGGQ